MSLRKWMRRQAIELALAKAAPSVIPLSDRAKVVKRDYASVYLQDEAAEYLLDYTTTYGVRAKVLGNRPEDRGEVSLLNSGLADFSMEIRQYFGEIELHYCSDAKFVLHSLLGYKHLVRAKGRVAQAVFNRGHLVREDRMKVLRIFVESTLKRRETAFSAQSLMTEMYGPRWIHHPKRAETINYYSLVLASLEEARDLSSKKGTYHLQGGGLKTIADYELEERRHRDNRSRQTVLSILTAVLAFIGLGQLVIDVVGRPDTAPPAVAQPSNSAR